MASRLVAMLDGQLTTPSNKQFPAAASMVKSTLLDLLCPSVCAFTARGSHSIETVSDSTGPSLRRLVSDLQQHGAYFFLSFNHAFQPEHQVPVPARACH